ncbi:MAG: TetR/AcrR family transcriptional regulator [Clostridia bacterium]|nr:TetR/AcrR family transcriptional regulator [Clostridia bacterium]
MTKKNVRNTKGKIILAAWKLFYEQGYEETTIEEIIEESGTSKGSFYHYFTGKDSLLSSLSYMFDEKYEELMEQLDSDMNSFDKLMYLNKELFFVVENSISIELLTKLYSSQLTTKGERHLLDKNRTYYRILRNIFSEGQARGEITKELTVNELVKLYALCERAFLYDWCLSNGGYSLTRYSAEMFPMFLAKIKI